MIPFAQKASPFDRFMYQTKGVADNKARLWLKDKGALAKYQGEARWPKTLATAWLNLGYGSACNEAIVMQPYCCNTKKAHGLPVCGRRITQHEQETTRICTACSTPWRDQLPSGKPTVHSYDYFICPSWNIAQMLTLPEFSDSLIDFWPSALEMLDRDPGDLSFAVDDVLSGTGARQLYERRSADIVFNPVPGTRCASVCKQ